MSVLVGLRLPASADVKLHRMTTAPFGADRPIV